MSVPRKIKKAVINPRIIPAYIREKTINGVIAINNAAVDLFQRKKYSVPTGLKEFADVVERARIKTDVNDHLVPLFLEAIALRPRLIVELGVRGGETAFVLERVAGLCKSHLVLVDIDDCPNLDSGPDTFFVHSDDIAFSGRFREWCKDYAIEPRIDILHIDTSHLYEHTVKEIENWFPFLSRGAIVFFHDTNLSAVFRRRDGSMGRGWNNDRGVIRAIEDFLDAPLNEKAGFEGITNGWLVKHDPCCNGFTTLARLDLGG